MDDKVGVFSEGWLREGLVDVRLDEMEVPGIPPLEEAFPCPFLVTPDGVYVAVQSVLQVFLHDGVNQQASDQSGAAGEDQRLAGEPAPRDEGACSQKLQVFLIEGMAERRHFR